MLYTTYFWGDKAIKVYTVGNVARMIWSRNSY